MSISSLVDGSRATIVGNIVGVRNSSYGDGGQMNMMQFEVQDQTGTIPAIVWNDAFSTMSSILKAGSTYKFINVNIRANPRQENRLEIKIYPDTRIEAHAPLKLEFERTTIAGTQSGVAHIRGVVILKSEETETLRSGEIRRIMLGDETGEVTTLLEGESLQAEFGVGDCVEVDGRYNPDHRSGATLYVHTLKVIEDEKLRSYWDDTAEEHKNKKLKKDAIVVKNLSDLKDIEIGSRGDFKGMVRSCGLIPQTLSKGRIKHSLSIVDDSLTAIDVGIFCDESVPFEVKIGDVVTMQGTISSYNTKSITANAVTKLASDPLYEWWTKNTGAVFDELSFDPRNATSASN